MKRDDIQQSWSFDMSVRYLAIQDYGSRRRDEGRKTLEKVTGLILTGKLDDTDIFVSSRADCVALPDGAGFVLGHLFTRQGNFRRLRSSDLPSSDLGPGAIIRYLLEDCWGGYVAVLKGERPNELVVVRDPSGMMPCYYLHTAEGTIASSDCETLLRARRLIPKIDWTYVIHHLFCQDLRSIATGLEGLMDLLPGFMLISSSAGVANAMVWNPWDFVGDTEGPHLPQRLEATIDRCVGAWGSAFSSILAPVSGGLDSSIIAAALRAQGTPWRGLNMATDEYEGDERHYARLLTRHLSAPLDEAFHKVVDVDVAIARSWHLPRPHAYSFAQSEDRTTRTLLSRYSMDAVFTGHGGDNVFCFLQSATPLVDRVRSQGVSRGTWQTLNDLCTLTGCSLVEAVSMAMRRHFQGSAAYAWSGDNSYLNRDALDRTGRTLNHPWLDAPKGALPGKAVHIAALLRILGSLESPSRTSAPPLVAPFLSQPIVELCLSVPTWKWFEGGDNRSIVRRAFASRLPRELIERQWKGGPNSFCLDVVAANRNRLRTFLLEGLLAQHEILDRPALQALFDQSEPIGPPAHLRIGFLAEAEAWARHWSQMSCKFDTDLCGR